ncbi:DUF4270 family protein [Neolewinella antarctica]|uniref:DUF4270 family protein n=1 Tax=Neolewinella antarctica TaxID=442734 RepID=A0ABX0XBK1_9BACT|nr:DUF4270 family protein [Neolewinella antarctica]NJC26208.1 hypothetical protein [Neolewinella antarctica]
MKHLLLFLPLCLVVFTTCTDPITVGSDILDGDRAAVGQLADLPFTTRVVRDDSLLVYRANGGPTLFGFTVGHSQDPIFGEWTYGVSLVPSLQINTTTRKAVLPEFVTTDDVLIDSIVLILPIDTFQGFYGPDTNNFSVRLLRLANTLSGDVNQYTSDPKPATGENLLEGTAISATSRATLVYDTIYTRPAPGAATLPHLRLKMNQTFVDEINALDSLAFANDTIFRSVFAGVYLEPTNDADGFVPIRPLPRSGQSERSGFYFFYQDPDDNDDASFYRAPLRSWRPHYVRDYTGSLAEELLNGNDDTGTLLVGGTSSLMTEITFPNFAALENALINRAESTFFKKTVAGYDYGEFPEPQVLVLYYRNNSGNLVRILDWRGVINLNQNLPTRNFLGGFQEIAGEDIFYRNGLTVQLQGLIRGGFSEPKIYLRVNPAPPRGQNSPRETDDPSRIILHSERADTTPAVLNVIFTNVGQ